MDIRPVKPTADTPFGGGGMKKSPLLTPIPAEVVTEMCPEADLVGTFAVMLVDVAEPAGE